MVRVTARAVNSQVRSGPVRTASPKYSPSASTATVLPWSYAPGAIWRTLPWAIRNTWSAGRPASTSTSPGAYSRWTQPSASDSSTEVSPKPRSVGSSPSSGGMTRTCDPVVMNSTRPSPTV